MALGAERRKVTMMVVGEGARMAFIGICAGLAAGFFASRVLAAFLFEVTPTDPGTFASVDPLGYGSCGGLLRTRSASL
jgi:ABC-type antimicrobial peptide transport system permease subunit